MGAMNLVHRAYHFGGQSTHLLIDTGRRIALTEVVYRPNSVVSSVGGSRNGRTNGFGPAGRTPVTVSVETVRLVKELAALSIDRA
jgi:hypothetical protein